MSRRKLKTKPARIADFPKPYRDTLAYWSTLRNLGFDASEIFFGFGEVSGQADCLHLQLKTQGKTFTVLTATLPGANGQQVRTQWGRFCKLVQRSTEPERAACYHDHVIGQNHEYFACLVMMIQEKGIVVPELPHLSPHAGEA